ncbi:hypothetical protein WA026_020171 [Henosepilachna vigintioctopunctata]
MTRMNGALNIITLLLTAVITEGIDLSQCIHSLGMENGMIPNEHITASSSYDVKNVGPQQGRIRNELQGGAWCPLHPVMSDLKEYIEIELPGVHIITSTGIQGRFGNGQGVEFTEFYVIEYWRPSLNKWIRYHNRTGNEVMKGNFNTYLESKYQLNPPIWASRIRFLPFSYHKRTVCMRVEVYGCYWSEGIISYSMPQGDKRSSTWELYDTSYDGYWDGKELRYGLGQLTDGQLAPDDFKMAFYTLTIPGWIGWKNDSKENNTIDINFEFDSVREFSSLTMHCNNQFTKEIQVFAAAKIYFSMDGTHFKDEPIIYNSMEDLIFENPRNISIKLYQRIGKFVKIKLLFASRWILLSEVNFISKVVNLPFSVENKNNILNDSVVIPKLSDEKEANVSNSQEEVESYVGVFVGIFFVAVLILIGAIVLVVMAQRHYKSTLRSSQIRSECDKVVLYQEPILGRFSPSSEYAEVRETEYAVPHEPSPQHCSNSSSFLNFLPKLHSESPAQCYYAATPVSNEELISSPRRLPMSTSVMLNGQSRYIFNTSKFPVEHNL